MPGIGRAIKNAVDEAAEGLRKFGNDLRINQKRQADKIRNDTNKARDWDSSQGAPSANVDVIASKGPGKGSGSKRKKRKESAREEYLGRTPGKNSRTGREVQERMRREGTLRDNPMTGRPEVLDSRTGEFIDINDTDMGHKRDAVDYWNKEGKNYGPKSPEVREWMLNPDNYRLEPAFGPGGNRSRGAQNGQNYEPPPAS